ncbi:nucleoside diphosphate kinase regulator [Chitinilyticum litopenaei]|uniref:nucleoside diphosphate kinase regulator n=1 Tax=Chitinilyticum litopenaei TaxID=1121276 RepID=UPI00041749AF|nr:nucleoside diphosphate kinase regulator [Chitinilyticum litopenaei]
MSNLPPIIVSTVDLERLYRVLDDAPDSVYATAVALENELARAQVVDPEDMPPDVVTMRSIVRFQIIPGGREFELTLCYPDEMDDNPHKVSVLAPVGAAMLGLAAGQEIDWPAPGGGQVRVVILGVTWQPERAGMLGL